MKCRPVLLETKRVLLCSVMLLRFTPNRSSALRARLRATGSHKVISVLKLRGGDGQFAPDFLQAITETGAAQS